MKYFACLILLGVLMTGAGSRAMADDLIDKAREAADMSNQFGLDLYHQLAGDSKQNLFLSPYSIESALSMTCAGARGQTAAQMARVLQLHLPADQVHSAMAALISELNTTAQIGNERAFDLVTANALWAQRGFDFNPVFLKLAQDQYRAGVTPLDFAGGAEALEKSRVTINRWVEQQTRDKIKDLIGKGVINGDTRLVLTNAIYFKSAWETKFAKEATREEAFHVGPSESANVPTMHMTHRLHYMDTASLQAIELPYLFHRLSMIVLLPRKMDGIGDLETSLSAKRLAEWAGQMQTREVELSLPKFTYTSSFSLSSTLQKMGMTDAFSGQADFSGMSSQGRLMISEVIHKAFVDVNEEGTEAAAATAVAMALAAMPEPVEKAVFKADHPFLFAIRDNASGAILFMGRVTNPKP